MTENRVLLKASAVWSTLVAKYGSIKGLWPNDVNNLSSFSDGILFEGTDEFFYKVGAQVDIVALNDVDKSCPHQYIFIIFNHSDFNGGSHACVLDKFDEEKKEWVLFNSWGD